MEDALAREVKDFSSSRLVSLNPCFNGRCTRTIYKICYRLVKPVLILVLMEDALALCERGTLNSCLKLS